VCGKPTVHDHRPFCSKGCADIDLNRWLSNSYVIPAREGEAAEAADPETEGADDERQ
jgi:endogenous inhibitor of DNA gyrase (YacG/DUF329 family)